jgi:hypothetical protein
MYGLATRTVPHLHIPEGLKRYTRPHRGQSDHLRIAGISKSPRQPEWVRSYILYNLLEFVVLMKDTKGKLEFFNSEGMARDASKDIGG